jgi:hypothetical protein
MNQYFKLHKTDFMLYLNLPGYCQSIQLNDGTIQGVKKKNQATWLVGSSQTKELANFPYL